jgi:methyl-accepting chemotaxis protein
MNEHRHKDPASPRDRLGDETPSGPDVLRRWAWFRNLPLGGKIGAGFGVLLVLTVAIVGAAYAGLSRVRTCNSRMALADRMIVDIQQARIHERDFVLRGDERDAERTVAAVEHLLQAAAESLRDEDLKPHVLPLQRAGAGYKDAFATYRRHAAERQARLETMVQAARSLETRADAMRTSELQRAQDVTRRARELDAEALETSNQARDLLLLVQTSRAWEQAFLASRNIHHQFKCGESIDKLVEQCGRMPKGVSEEKVRGLVAATKAYQDLFTEWVGGEGLLGKLQQEITGRLQGAVDTALRLLGEKADPPPPSLSTDERNRVLRLLARIQAVRLHEWDRELAKFEKFQEKEAAKAEAVARDDLSAAIKAAGELEGTLAAPEADPLARSIRPALEAYRAAVERMREQRAALKIREASRAASVHQMTSLAEELLADVGARLGKARADFRAALASAETKAESANRLLRLVQACRLHEIRFVTDGSDDERDRVLEVLNEMGRDIGNLPDGAGRLQASIGTYRQEFQDLVEIAGALRRSETVMNEAAVEVANTGVAYSRDQADHLRKAISASFWTMGIAAGAALAAGVFLAFLITRSVTRPVAETVGVIRRLEQGDMTMRPGGDSDDEIGQMGRALGVALDRVGRALGRIAVDGETLAAAARRLRGVSQGIGSDAVEVSSRARTVSAAAEEVSRNVHSVAAATGQLTASIGHIARSMTEATQVAAEASREAEQSGETVAKLGDSGTRIGKVTQVIQGIAKQTNLLAINAAIEAARAGEAGKGFAVVAHEVRELARQTSGATDDIGRLIGGIQDDVRAVVEAVSRINRIIARLGDLHNGVTAAIEQQSASTAGINQSVGTAARESQAISRDIAGVRQAAEQTSAGMAQILEAAGSLATLSADLKDMLSGFQCGPRHERGTTPPGEGGNGPGAGPDVQRRAGC